MTRRAPGECSRIADRQARVSNGLFQTGTIMSTEEVVIFIIKKNRIAAPVNNPAGAKLRCAPKEAFKDGCKLVVFQQSAQVVQK